MDFAQLGEIFLTSATLKFENDLYVISLNWFVIATGFVQNQICQAVQDFFHQQYLKPPPIKSITTA